MQPGVSSFEEGSGLCVYSLPPGLQVGMGYGGFGVGKEKGSTALPRSNSVADKGGEEFCLMSLSSH